MGEKPAGCCPRCGAPPAVRVAEWRGSGSIVLSVQCQRCIIRGVVVHFEVTIHDKAA